MMKTYIFKLVVGSSHSLNLEKQKTTNNLEQEEFTFDNVSVQVSLRLPRQFH